jgi:uncharacterized membrane protein (DUF106 family)
MNLLTEFIKAQPLISIILFSFLITFGLALLQKKFTDQQRLKEIHAQQKEMRDKSNMLRNEPQKLLELQNEMMKLSSEQMRISFKPMMISFVPIVFIFMLLKQAYTEAGIGDIISWHVNLPLFGTGAGWFLLYILLGIIFNSLLRKVLKIY